MTGKLLPRYENFDFDAFIDAANVRAFIGKNYDYYRRIWTVDYERRGRRPERVWMAYHWNWLAILGLPAWFGYRRMYMAAILWTALLCCMSFVEKMMDWNAPGGFYVAVNLLMLLKSKGLYFDHIVRFFDDHKSLPAEQMEDSIRRCGGTSVLWAFVLGIGGASAVALSAFIADTLFGHHALAIEPIPPSTMTG